MIKTLTTLFKQDKEKFVVPKGVQDVLPVNVIYDDGIFKSGKDKYSKSFKFTDINYAVASREDKEAMFLEYSELLNALDSGATTKLTINNRRLNRLDFEKTILIPRKEDELDEYREEYNKMLLDKATGANATVQDKYVTISINKKSVEDARTYFSRVGADLISHFSRLGSKCVELETDERLRIIHDFFRVGEESTFHFDPKDNRKKGHSFKDYICPDSMEFENDYFKMGKRYGRVIFLREYASYIKDSMVAELTDMNRNLMMSVDIVPVPTDEANLSGKQIIEADYDTISNFIRTMIGLLVLLVLVFMSGYLFIYNTLYISVNRDIRYFGQLKTIGTTSVQIRKMIYKQMLWNAMIGIPLGLVCSTIIGKIIIPQLLHSLNPTIAISEVGTISLWVFIIATIFSLTTTMISSQKPVKIAMNCSPIEAMKYIGATSIKNKNKKRRGGDIGSMVKMNLFRDKKQFVVIMCSLSLAVSLFLIINVVIYANNAKNILNHSYDYDIRLLNQTLLSDKEEQVFNSDFIEQIKSIDGVKDVRVLKSATAVVPYQENVYGEYYKELYASRYSPGNYDKDIELYKKQPDHYSFTCRVVGIDEVEFEKINNTLQNSLDKEKFKNGEIAFVSKSFTQGDNGITEKKVEFSIPTALNPDKKEIVETGAIIDDYPAYYSAGYTPDLIVSDEFFDEIMGQPLIEMIKIDYDEPFSKNVESSIKKLVANNNLISAESKLDNYSEMKNSENQITVLGGSLGIIIMLLAISNYLNMMSESIQNRSKEFAILESVGMTRKQIKKVIVFESLGYSILSIVIALIIGLPASYLVFTNFNIYRIPYSFPVIKTLFLFLIIIIVCVVTSLFVFSKSKSETIIELLRKDET